MSFANFHYFITISRPVNTSFIQYMPFADFCSLTLFQENSTISHKPFKWYMPSEGFSNTHQQESPAQYFAFICRLSKTLKVYIIVHPTQVTCNTYCISFSAMYSNPSCHASL